MLAINVTEKPKYVLSNLFYETSQNKFNFFLDWSMNIGIRKLHIHNGF